MKRLLNYYNFSDYLNTRNKALIALLADTGLRNFEVCSLEIHNIKELHIVVKGKRNKERHVAISPYLKKHLIKYERIRDYYFKEKTFKCDYYFLSSTGKQLTVEAIERVVKIAGEEIGIGKGKRKDIRCSPHTLGTGLLKLN